MTKREDNTKQARAKRHKGFAGQNKDEQIIRVEHQHPVVMRKQLIFGLIIILIVLLPWAYATGGGYEWAVYTNWLVFAGLLILAFYWVRTWVSWYYSVYVLTSQRLMIVKQHGFFGREVSELALNNIQNVNYKIKGAQASLLGYGNITVETLSGSKPLRLKVVHKPVRLQQAILEVVRRTSD